MGFNFVGCITQMFNGDFVTGGYGDTFFPCPFPRYNLLQCCVSIWYQPPEDLMEFRKDTLTLESADEIL